MTQDLAWQIFFNGLMLSASYVLIAAGLTLIFGVMRIMNFAHGELIMLGGYVAWLLFAERHVPFLVSVVVALLAVGSLGVMLERGLFKPQRGNPFGAFIISLGLVFILQASALQVIGPRDKALPVAFPGDLQILGVSLSFSRLMIVPAVAAMMALLWLFLKRAKYGQALRACAQDSEGASLQGISFDRMSALAMGIGSAFAGAAGALLSQLMPVGAFMGSLVILKAFIVVIVGGMGSIEGAIAAGLLFGFMDSAVTTLVHSKAATLLDVVVMLAVLVARPQGLLGREQRKA